MTENLRAEQESLMEQKVADLLDRRDIEDSISRYSLGIDNREWASWVGLFTGDAVLDYSAIGVGMIAPDDFRALVSKNDSIRISGQHLHSNVLIEVEGDSATARAEYTMSNLVRLDDDPGFGKMTRAGGWVLYELSRIDRSWRIGRRITYTKWSEGLRLAIST